MFRTFVRGIIALRSSFSVPPTIRQRSVSEDEVGLKILDSFAHVIQMSGPPVASWPSSCSASRCSLVSLGSISSLKSSKY